MEHYYPKHFDPAKYLGIDGGDPEYSTSDPWSKWIHGDEPLFGKEFAEFLWWHFADVLHTFVCWENYHGTFPKRYFGCDALAVARFRRDLSQNFEIVAKAIGEAWSTNPFGFESRLHNAAIEVLGNRKYKQIPSKQIEVQTACAYSLMCLDDGISGLLTKNPKKSGLAFAYALRGLFMAHEYQEPDTRAGNESISYRAALSKNAKLAADALHSKPGGSRDKRQQIRNLWASGKYSSRDICAEQECSALGMSFSAARKALIGTPNPDLAAASKG